MLIRLHERVWLDTGGTVTSFGSDGAGRLACYMTPLGGQPVLVTSEADQVQRLWTAYVSGSNVAGAVSRVDESDVRASEPYDWDARQIANAFEDVAPPPPPVPPAPPSPRLLRIDPDRVRDRLAQIETQGGYENA